MPLAGGGSLDEHPGSQQPGPPQQPPGHDNPSASQNEAGPGTIHGRDKMANIMPNWMASRERQRPEWASRERQRPEEAINIRFPPVADAPGSPESETLSSKFPAAAIFPIEELFRARSI